MHSRGFRTSDAHKCNWSKCLDVTTCFHAFSDIPKSLEFLIPVLHNYTVSYILGAACMHENESLNSPICTAGSQVDTPVVSLINFCGNTPITGCHWRHFTVEQ